MAPKIIGIGKGKKSKGNGNNNSNWRQRQMRWSNNNHLFLNLVGFNDTKCTCWFHKRSHTHAAIQSSKPHKSNKMWINARNKSETKWSDWAKENQNKTVDFARVYLPLTTRKKIASYDFCSLSMVWVFNCATFLFILAVRAASSASKCE